MRQIFLFVFIFAAFFAFAQRMVKGKVVDETGETLPGVNVVIKGTSTGVVTDFDGKYAITVQDDQTLIFSYIGYKTKRIKVGTQSVIDIALKSEVTEIDEVVVTALGLKKNKAQLGYATSEVGSDELDKIPEVNAIQALSGKVAGVLITGSGGTPGASSKVVIRGASTFSGETQPLIVIDGVPMDNTTTQTTAGDNPYNSNLSGVNNSNRAIDINPDDIASVTVLKGAAAAALYGSRAGNGAIIYTTKTGGKAKKGYGATFSQSFEINEVNKLPKLQNTYAQGSNGVSSPTGSESWGPRIGEGNNLQSYDNTGNFFMKGLTSKTNVSISGGSDKGKVRFSFENTNQKGMVPNTFYKRISARVTGSRKVSDLLSYSATVAYINSKNRASQNGSNVAGVMLGLLRTSSNFDIRNYQNPNGTNRSYNGFYDNPFFTVNKNPFDSEVNRVIGNVSLSLKFHKLLNLSYKIGVDTYGDERRQIIAPSSYNNNLGDGVGQVEYNNLRSSNLYADLIISGGFDVNKKHTINYTIGHNTFYKNFADYYSRGEGFSVQQGFYNLSNAKSLYASNVDEDEFSTAFFGQIEYGLADQFFLTVTGRNEMSSTFGADNRSFFYPSVSMSWIASKTFKLPSWISFAKLRASYAQVGITPTPYRSINVYTRPVITDGFTNGLGFPYGSANGFSRSNILRSTDLQPERKIGYEVGTTLDFINRIRLNFTYFLENTTNILIERPVAPSSGFDVVYGNSGELENRGIELELSGDIIRSNDFTWELGLNLSSYKTKTLKLASGVNQVSIESAFTSIGSYAIIGQPVGVFYGTKWKRNTQGQLLIGSDGLPLKEEQQGGVGNPNPDWIGGIRNTFSYKGFQLSAFIDIRVGTDVYNGTYARLNRFGRTQESAEHRSGGYLIPGVKADANGNPTTASNDIRITAKKYFSSYLGDDGGAAEQFVETVNWLRLRDVSLTYSLPRSVLDKIGFFNSIRLRLSGRNLLLLTNYKGVDPETSLTGAGSNIGGFDYFNNPGSKSYGFSVSFGF